MTEPLDTPDDTSARLILNARAYRYDATLDPAADQLEQGHTLPPRLADLAALQKGMRDTYRTAVDAGLVPAEADINPKENRR